ncbi:hypothetical protein HOLleu_29301 [Holothuria leucospilota]|uniref:Coiled-coil domain-containing protein 171 n=1 Tax=Holothuria leucospilota TaxID=206669 RepID=A0A9Q1BN46_HOLLE|nr:hypothetical protein HOLleu_29301 [Holothuria leucospilota]
MSTPVDSLNSHISESDDYLVARTPSPMAAEFLQPYQSRNASPSPKPSIIFKSEDYSGFGQLTELRQRINSLEEQRLKLTTSHNEQVTKLEEEVARWRGEVEKGEATRQKLEYELAVIKKSLTREKEVTTQKEHHANLNLQQYQAKTVELTAKNKELAEALTLREKETLQVVETLKKEISEKDSEIKTINEQKEKLRKDKEQVERVFTEQENLYSEAQEKLANLRMERDTQTESVRRQLKDLHYAAEREERFKKEMEVALAKIKSLEESTEAERAAHLETKFNSELIQLRVRDLQGALEVEKAAHSELIRKTEALEKQVSDLELAYSKEQAAANDARSQIERVQNEYSSVKSRLSAEMEGKHAMVSDMSEQLQIHQQSFSELKEELKKARKRQAYLEETYGGCMKELELLIDNVQNMQQPIAKKGRKKSETPSPMEVLEMLRQITTDFQKRLLNASKEVVNLVTRLKTDYEKISQECQQYKEIMWEQYKSNKDLQKKLTVSTKELEKVRQALSEHQTHTAAMKVALQRAEQDHYSEKSKGQDLAEEFIRQLKNLEEQSENRKLYLHGLYQRIHAGPVIPGVDPTKLCDPSWEQLTETVQEQVVSLINAFNQANQKVTHLETALKKKEALLHQVQEAHEDSLYKLKEAGEKREKDWGTQRSKMEKHYEKQLLDLRAKAKKTQESAQHAWQSAQTATSAKSELEASSQHLQELLSTTQDKLNSALISCSLLLGSLWSHRCQMRELIHQRHLLVGQIYRFETLKNHLQQFVSTVSSTMEKESQVKGRLHPLLMFRVGAVTVLAANRLQRLAAQKAAAYEVVPSVKGQTFVLPMYFWPPCLHNLYPDRGRAPGSSQYAVLPLSAWIEEDQLITALQDSVSQVKQELSVEGPADRGVSWQSAHQGLSQVLSKVGTLMSHQLTTRYQSPTVGKVSFGGNGSLVRHLFNGLSRALAISSMGGSSNCFSSQEMLSTLKKHLVNFTQRLYSGEVERRSLRLEVSQLKEDANGVLQAEQRSEALMREIVELKAEAKNLVSKEKFDSVCEELTKALRREEEAQRFLNEQSDQLEELNLKLNVQTTDDLEKQRTIAEAFKGLSDASMDLKRQEQTIHQLKRQIIHLEEEKQSLKDAMRDAENTLKLNNKDKDALLLYLKSIESSVEKSRRSLLHKPDSQSLQFIFNQLSTSATMPGLNLKEPEASIIQNLLQAFTDAQKTAVSKIVMLGDEITSHKQHIASLKKELSAACRREHDGEETLKPCGDPMAMVTSFLPPGKDHGPSLSMHYRSERSYAEEFAPLREAMDYSSQGTPASKTSGVWSMK